ncbi:MAG: lamin tail domain-containing protein [Solirubrobacterales bacterium]
MKAVAFLWMCVLGMACSVRAAGGPVLINELMAANTDYYADSQGEYDDWVELHNAGDTQANLTGMCLTDDEKVPAKWRIPYGTKIAAKEYLVIWLDQDIADSGLHASFGLNASGDQLLLYDVDGVTLLDYVSFGRQRNNISYGRSTSEVDVWRFMMLPTPGALNTLGYDGVVADTKFDHDRGFYAEPFDVTIMSDTPDATIYYTLDGSEPVASPGRVPNGRIYSSPIHISTTTCLRACAVKDGWLSSDVDTQTYIFLSDAVTRPQADVLAEGYPAQWFGTYPADYEMDPEVYGDPAYADRIGDAMLSIPTVSLVTGRGNLFNRTSDPETGGIYIYTGHGSTGGQGWERPVSIEMFTADGVREFHVNCGVRIQGGENRNPQKCPKHGFGLRFRSEYGPSRFEFPLFEESPVDTFDSLQLRGFFNNSWIHWGADQRQHAQFVHDQWMHDSMLDMGHADAGRGLFVHLYINGIYWGLYALVERPVAAHYAAYNGGDPATLDAINGGSASDGTTQAWQETRTIVASKNWARIQERIDIDNFIDWTLLNLFAGNQDLKTDGNWRAAGGGPDKKPWRFYVWDGERVCESVNQTGTSPSSDPTGWLGTLEDIEEFRVRFGDRVHKHLFNGGALTPECNAQRWRTRTDEIDMAVIAESARWGDYRRDVHTYSDGPFELYMRDEHWVQERDRVLNEYFPKRTSVALSQFRSRGFYPSVDAPVFYVGGVYQHGGQMSSTSGLTMQAGSTVYYTLDGSDPRTPGVDASTGEGATTLVAESAAKRVLVPTASLGNAWRGGQDFDDSAWIGGIGGVGIEQSTGYESLFSIDLGESMYAQQTTCYIRIPFVLNQDPTKLASVQLKVRYDDGFVAWINGVEVARRNFTGEPAWNSAAETSNSDIDAVELEAISLSNAQSCLKTGQNILAIQPMNQSAGSSDFLLSAMLVSSGATSGTPAGVSAAAIRYTGEIHLTESACVKARALSGSAWSALNEAVYAVGPVAESLRISEIQYHPATDPNAEFIELTNIGSATINLNRVEFTRGVQYGFPNYELTPGGYCLLVRDSAAFEAVYGNGLPVAGQYAGSLDNAGEKIELVDAAGGTIESFKYKDSWFDPTDGEGFSLTRRDPAASADPADEAAWRPSAAIGGSPGVDDNE